MSDMNESSTSSRGRRGRILAVVAVLLLIAVFGIRFRQLGRTEALASVRSVQEAEGIPVETVTAERGALARWINLAGTVEGTVQYPVVSNNALRVVAVPVREGDPVRAGDVIIRLAREAPTPMVHSYQKARAAHDSALKDARRLRNLYAEGAVSEQTLDAAETALAVAAADLQDAEDSTALLASEDGVVASILVTEGETVETGEPLAWVARTDSVKVRFAAGSLQALALAVGQGARWTAPGGTQAVDGVLHQLDLMADPETHLLEGEALFANPDGRLVPGLLVSIRVRTAHREDALVVPGRCLVQTDGGDAVWIVDGEGGAALRPVTTGLQTTDRVEIVDGLDAGELVVLHGQTLLSEGVKVKRVGAGEES
jgi:membrane fusion protein (multidrug efflux system)